MAHLIFITSYSEYRILFNGGLMHQMGRPEGRRPLVRHRHRWQDNIKIDLQEVRWGGMNWIDVIQSRDRCWAVVNMVMNVWVPWLIIWLVGWLVHQLVCTY
jgi:hypothetical protein